MLVMALVVALVVPEHLVTFYPPEKVEEVQEAESKASDSKVSELVIEKPLSTTESTSTWNQRIFSINNSVANSTSTINSQKKRSVRESMLDTEEPVTGEGYDWSDLRSSYTRILSNFAYVSMTGVLTTNLGTVAVISIYGIQYLSEVYNMSITSASFIFR